MTSEYLISWIDDYLALRRGMGFDLRDTRAMLVDFAHYVDGTHHPGAFTAQMIVTWACSGPVSRARARTRFTAVRGFAQYLRTFDPAIEVPAADAVTSGRHRVQPHIYSDAEFAELCRQAAAMRPRGGLRPRTYVTYFSLLLATGLRLSEACALETADVDLVNGLLTVRSGKFRKSRLVPLHPTATQALARYARFRDACPVVSRSERFFRTDNIPALEPKAVKATFSRLRAQLGWTTEGRVRRPRIHDMRHTFAVRRLLRWYEQGADVDRKILALATYLGHTRVSHTYWYLCAVPELMAITSQRFEHFAQRPQEVGS